MKFSSITTIESKIHAGVRFGVARMTFGRRLELTRRVRELGQRIEFQQAGQTLDDKLAAAIAGAEIDRLYLEWGLAKIEGLEIDGESADKRALIDAGPEDLTREILSEIRRETGLNEEEIKN